MLYLYDIRILKACKKAQKDEESYVLIDANNFKCYHCPELSMSASKKALEGEWSSSFSILVTSFNASIEHLIQTGCLVRPALGNIYHVTHAGWFSSHVTRCEIAKLILTHVFFPSFVAFITTIITIWINSFLE